MCESTTTDRGESLLPETESNSMLYQGRNMDSTADLTEHFNFCRKHVLGDQDDLTAHVDIWYQCQGEEYDHLMNHVDKFVRKLVNKDQKPASWGKRRHPFPANSNILIFGNSHSRQIGMALACQHDQLQQVYRFDTHMIDDMMAQRFTFNNNATMYLVTNSYVSYSPNWKKLLEKQIDVSLDDMDAVVLGVFNGAEAGESLSRFATNMQEMTKLLPKEWEVDNVVHDSPSVADVASVYNGIILFTSIFGNNRKSNILRNRNDIDELIQHGNRTHAAFVKSRRYLEKMKLEGGSPSKLDVSQCHNDKKDASKMHRCMGARGGHPDLIAWDISEHVYGYLTAKRTVTSISV